MTIFEKEKKRTIKSILKQIIYDRRLSPGDFYILFRGTNEQIFKARVSDISLEQFWFVLNEKTIPYHRIVEIGNSITGEIILKRTYHRFKKRL